jgi:hypothetical protein
MTMAPDAPLDAVTKRGERACLVCHADPRRRRLIETLAGS